MSWLFMNGFTMNTGVHVFFLKYKFVWIYAQKWDCWITWQLYFSFLRNLHTVFHSCRPIHFWGFNEVGSSRHCTENCFKMLEFYFGSLNGNFYLSSYVAYIFLGVFPRRRWVHWKQKPWLNHLWILRIYQGPSELSEWAINSSSLNFSRSKSQLLLKQIYSSKSNLCTFKYNIVW